MKPFEFHQGTIPLLVSIPHAGTALTPEVVEGLSAEASSIPDTDWHIPILYDFVKDMGASIIIGNYSRMVVDLNRPPDNQPLYKTATTGLFPETLFNGTPVFRAGLTPSEKVREEYLYDIWWPYHNKIQDELNRIKEIHGRVMLYDAHSINSYIPRLFDGVLPDINIGTNDYLSCKESIINAFASICAVQKKYSWVINGRFKGGHITRHYGRPDINQHAIQIELSQKTYMNEKYPFDYDGMLALELRRVLKRFFKSGLEML